MGPAFFRFPGGNNLVCRSFVALILTYALLTILVLRIGGESFHIAVPSMPESRRSLLGRDVWNAMAVECYRRVPAGPPWKGG